MKLRGVLFSLAILICDVACSMTELDTIPSILPTEDTLAIMRGDTITIMQWNIGHFSFGAYKDSRVNDGNFMIVREEFRSLFTQVNPSIISINEYSYYFANTSDHPHCAADTSLFSQYPYMVIGNDTIQRRYSMNAIFSAFAITESATVEYEANKSATITSSSSIAATDYYYVKSTIPIGDKDITFISTHLAFDSNNQQVVLDQLKELIVALADIELVIICGDFNTDATNLSLFSEAGYSKANDGSFLTYPVPYTYLSLDNIFVKGLSISNPRTIPTLLSDHLPLVCEISLNSNLDENDER